MTVEKILTPEQQAQLDEDRRLDELRRAQGKIRRQASSVSNLPEGKILIKNDTLKNIILMEYLKIFDNLHT